MGFHLLSSTSSWVAPSCLRHEIIQGIHVVEITRADLAGRKEYFAWGHSDCR
jgi:hypothetical protein